MKRLSKKIILITLSALFIIASLSVTFAWLFAPAKRDLVFDTSVRLSYFESGDGSETSPYEIKYPLQLYYLAWLQDIGYFNDIKDTSGKVIPTYFYLSDNLDMDGWVLPSIGTAEHPFLGHFDGTNHVVSNLIIDNNQAQMKDPVTQEELGNEYTVTGPNAQIIGFFGVIGEYNGVASTNSSVVSAFNFALDNVNVKSTTPTDNKTLIGIVAGYLNGEIGNIFVADNCKVTIAETLTALTTVTTTISSYTVVGYATDKYKKTLNSETSTTDPLFDPAKGNGWGGSIDMLSLYNRLIAVRNSRTNVSAYPTEVHYNGNTTAIATSGTVSYIAQYGDKSIAGQYMMVHYDDQTDTTNFADAFNYIYGYDQLFRQTRLEFNVVDGTKEQFKIYSNGRYLYTTNGTSWGNTTNVNNAQYFQLSDEGYLFTIYNDRVYYVTVASTADGTSLTLSNDMTLEADLTQWTKDSGALRLKNTANRYLVYNGGWIISSTLTYAVYIPKEGAFSICSEDVYLNATNTLSTSNTNTTYWYLKDNHLMTYYGSTPYYVNANGTSLSYDTTASTDWVKTVDSLSTTVSGNKMYLLYINGNYRLVLDNSTNQATSGGFYYKHNGYYLNLTSETAVGTGTNGTVEEAATIWKLDASNHIYTTYKGNKYYLNRNGNNFTVNASTTANTQWTMINGFATLEISSVTYYLVYDSGWKLAHILDDSSANSMTFTQNTWYTIAYNSNYLNLNNSQSFARGTSQPTFWSAPTNTTSTSLYTTYNGTRYYLTGTTLGVSSADNNFNTYSKWRKSGNSIYYYSGNTSYYLKYNRNNNNQWLLRDSTNNRDRDGYGYNQLTITAVTVNTISYNGTYLNLTGINSVGTGTSGTDVNKATRWVVPASGSSGTIYTNYNDNSYYLTVSGGSLSLSTSAPSNNWNRMANGKLYMVVNDTRYYLNFDGSSWGVTSIGNGIEQSFVSTNPQVSASSTFNVYQNNNYINLNSTTSTSTGNNADNATVWKYDTNNYYTAFNGNRYYLYFNNGFTVGNSTNSDNLAYFGGASGKNVINGYTFYTITINDVATSVLDNGTNQTVHNGFYYLYDNYYLNLTGTDSVGLGTNGTNEAAATIWLMDEDNHVYTLFNNSKYYLNRNGDTFTVNAGATATTVWNTINGFLSIEIDSSTYCLIYSSGWKLVKITQVGDEIDDSSMPNITFNSETWYKIHANHNYSNGDKYFNLTTTNTSTDMTSASFTDVTKATWWYANANGSAFGLYTNYNNNSYYIVKNSFYPRVSTTANTNFTYDSTNKNLKLSSDYFYYYSTSYGWNIDTSGSGRYVVNLVETLVNTISYGGSYLNLTGTNSFGRGTDSSKATRWIVPTSGSSGNIYYNYNGNSYYFYYNGSNLAIDTNEPTNKWVRTAEGKLYTTVNNKNYYLTLQANTWTVTTVPGLLYLSDLTDGGISNVRSYNVYQNDNYVNLSSTTTTSLGNDSTTATLWKYDTSNYYYYTGYNGTAYYLYFNNGFTVGTTSSSANIVKFMSVMSITLDDIEYDLSNNQGKDVTREEIHRTSYDEDTYFPIITVGDSDDYTDAENGVSQKIDSLLPHENNTGYIISGGRMDRHATYSWGVTTTATSLTINNNKISYTIDGNTYYLCANASTGLVYASTNSSEAQTWTLPNNNYSGRVSCTISGTTYYLYYSSGTMLISSSSYTSWTRTNTTRLRFSNNNNYYYLTVAAPQTTQGFPSGYGNTAGNIRVSQYAKTNLNSSLSNGTYYDSTVSVDSNGNVLYSTITTGSFTISNAYTARSSTTLGFGVRYSTARKKLNKLLEETNVYGLHFMDAKIDENNLMTASIVEINGISYENYQMPRNSIDFNLQTQGYITLFAGSYFSGNTALFSLHHIYRNNDETKTINLIKEIQNVYTKKVTTVVEEKSITTTYLYYLYKDGTYSLHYDKYGNYNASKYYLPNSDEEMSGDLISEFVNNGSLTGTLTFNTDWITRPENFVTNALYYFEIPASAGEYALGSVPGRTGAYLLYLDIAAYGETESQNSKEITTDMEFYDLPAGVQVIDKDSFDYDSLFELTASEPADWASKFDYYLKREGEGTDESPYIFKRVVGSKPTWASNTYYSTQYALSASEPDDWDTNYTAYYTRSGSGTQEDPYKYERIVGVKPTWASNTYYYLNYVLTESEPADWETNYLDYYIRTGEGTTGSPYVYAQSKGIAPTWASSTYYRCLLNENESVGARLAEGFSGNIQLTYVEEAFELTESQPADWATKYNNYYTRSGSGTAASPYIYTKVELENAPTWASGTYYKTNLTDGPALHNIYDGDSAIFKIIIDNTTPKELNNDINNEEVEGTYYYSVGYVKASYPPIGGVTAGNDTSGYFNLSAETTKLVNISRLVAKDNDDAALQQMERTVILQDFGNYDFLDVYNLESYNEETGKYEKKESFNSLIASKAIIIYDDNDEIVSKDFNEIVSFEYTFSTQDETEPTIQFTANYTPYGKYLVLIETSINLDINISLEDEFAGYEVTLVYTSSTGRIEKLITASETISVVSTINN